MKLEIKNLTAGYDQDVILKDFSLSVKEGEFLSLLGPSGCGKSTLLKTIAGIVPAKCGSVLLDGQDITNLPILVPEEKEAACLGAAIIAAVEDGKVESFEKMAESIRFEKTFTPVKSELLDEKYKKFNALYEFSCNLK